MAVHSVQAQNSSIGRPSIQQQHSEGLEPTVRPIVFGLGFGAVSFVAGGYLGAMAAGSCEGSDHCYLGAFLFGGYVGWSLGLAAGTHLGNRRRGNVGYTLAASAVVGGIGMAVALAVDDPWVVVMTPLVQLVSTVVVEREVSRASSRSNQFKMSFGPRSNGTWVVGAEVVF